MQWVIKGLTTGKRKTGGRNNTGRITAFHRGGGNKLRLRKVDYNRSQVAQSIGSADTSKLVSDRGCVQEIIKDPNHTGKLALIHWESRKRALRSNTGVPTGIAGLPIQNNLAWKQALAFSAGGERQEYTGLTESFSYILAPEGLKQGSTIVGHFGDDVCAVDSFSDSSSAPTGSIRKSVRVAYSNGNAYPLASLMTGTRIYNVDGKYARAAGCSAEIIAESRNGLVSIKLQSGQVKALSEKCIATIGSVSNPEHKNKKYRKAGEMRWLGRRPHVRGVAMNPVDHPHGGGEGKTSGGRPSVTPWGLPGKGKKTRRIR
jgi:large subunit ribosomal protein L2